MNLLEPDRGQIECFVNDLFRHAGADGFASIRAFNENENKPFRIQGVPLQAGLNYLIDVAEDVARRAANDPKRVVFCPPIGAFSNPNHATESDLLAGFALSVECDRYPAEARETLEGLLGPATVVVRSGGKWQNGDGQAQDKLHLHWRLRAPARGQALPGLKRARELATSIVGGDASNVPTVHPIRWPGSWHRKGDPVLCAIVAEDPDAEIDLSAALDVLTAAAPPKSRGDGQDTGQADTGERSDWAELTGNIIAGRDLHDSTVRLAASYIASGMAAPHVVRLLRSLMLVSATPHDERWQARFDDLGRIVAGAETKFRAPPEAEPATPIPDLCAPYVWRDPATLPARGWLYGKHYVRKFVSASIGEGGVGKSTLALTEAIVMTLRRPLLGKLPTTPDPLRVWYWNGEDPKGEIELRLAAICQHFELEGRELAGKLFVDGRDSPISLAAINRAGTFALNDPVLRLIADKITQNAIDVLILDPFVACHNVSENDNMAIDAVIKALGRIAEKTNCAIDLDHHTRKPATGQDGLTLSDARGASAIVYGVRSGRIFNQMTAAEADKAGLNPDDRKAYFRFDRTKANMAPAEFAVWHRLTPVTLPNGEDVAVVERWEFPDIFEGVTTAHMHAVRQKAQEGDYRADIRSKDWIGRAVIDTLGLGRDAKSKTRVKNILKTWFANDVLTKVERIDPKSRKEFEFVAPGDWHE